MSAVLSSLSTDFRLFAIPPVLVKNAVPAKLPISVIQLLTLCLVSNTSTNAVVVSIDSSFATTETRSGIVYLDICL